MVKSLAGLLLIAPLALAGPAAAASLTLVNPTTLQIPATGVDFNNLITALNAILTPLVPNVTGGVNQISLTAGTTGQPAVLGLQTGADTNAGIKIDPNGSGNIVLFGQGDTGALQFGNAAGFVAATGLGVCPAAPPSNRPLGVAATVTGYFTFADWTGKVHAVPAC